MSRRAVVITQARPATSVELQVRTRRYLATMVVRIGCFSSILVLPGWWKLIGLVGAAGLPWLAVLLANAQDMRKTNTLVPHHDELSHLEIAAGPTIEGEVDDS